MVEFVDLYEWIQTVEPEDLPPPPFELKTGITVIGRERFLRSLQQQCLTPDHPRARIGGLQEDLRSLYKILCNCDRTK